MKLLATVAISMLFYCTAFSQSWTDLTESVCDGEVFKDFKQFQLSKHLQLSPVPATYEKSLYYPGYPRISDLQVLEPNQELLSSLILAGTNLKKKSIQKLLNEDSLMKILPEVVKEYTNTYARTIGPNCFNATKNWFSKDIKIQKTTAVEIYDYLSSNFNELADGAEIKLGDVLLIYKSYYGNDSVQPIHTAVYIDSNTFWHKASDYPEDPWTFEDLTLEMNNFCLKSQGKIKIKFFRKIKPS